MAIIPNPRQPADALQARIRAGTLDPTPAVRRLLPPPAVMASPPTITYGGSSTALTSPNVYLPGDAPFTLYGHRLGDNGSGSMLGVSSTPNLNSGGGGAANANQTPFSLDFMFMGTQFEILTKGSEGKYRFIVDGEAHNASYVRLMGSPDYAQHHMLVAFASAGIRHIVFETTDNVGVYSLKCAKADTFFRSRLPATPRVIVLGDSFTEGSYGSSYPEAATLLNWVYWLGKYMGWRDIWSSGSGGTGYLNNASVTGKTTFRGRVAADVIAYAPDIVIVAGGYNDSASSQAAVTAEAALLFAQIATGLPSAKVIVLGPWATGGTVSAGLQGIRTGVKAAAVGTVDLFVDLYTGQSYNRAGVAVGAAQGAWWTGTGKSGSPAADGVADTVVAADGLHPTPTGHQYIAARAAAAIALALPL